MASSALCPLRSDVDLEALESVHAGSETRLKRSRKKTVSWPTDQSICEVRHFLVDEAPSSLGIVHENMRYLQAQQLSKSNMVGTKRARIEQDDIPPGFGLASIDAERCDLNTDSSTTMTASHRWQQPCKFLPNSSWFWARGEESEEIASQKEREKRVFEAFYPRLASIPDSPLEPPEPSMDVDDSIVVHIPSVSFEDETVHDSAKQESISLKIEDGDINMTVLAGVSSNVDSISVVKKQESSMKNADSNIAAVAAAACMVVKALGDDDLVDESLLIQILKNPSLLQSLNHANNEKDRKTLELAKKSTISWQAGSQKSHNLQHGPCLNGSTVSAVTHGTDDGEMLTNANKLNKVPNESTSMQQQCRGLKPTSRVQAYSAQFTRAHSCSDSKPSVGLFQNGVELTSHTQNPDNFQKNSPKIGNTNETCAHDHKRAKFLSSKDEIGTDVGAYITQAPYFRQPPTRVYPTPLTTKELSGKMVVKQSEDSRHIATALHRNAASIANFPLRTGNKSGRMCMFFNSPRGCRNGDSCAFIHQSGDFGKTPQLSFSNAPIQICNDY